MYVKEMSGSIWVKDMHLLNDAIATFNHSWICSKSEVKVSFGQWRKGEYKSVAQIDFLSPIEISEHIKESRLQITSCVKWSETSSSILSVETYYLFS